MQKIAKIVPAKKINPSLSGLSSERTTFRLESGLKISRNYHDEINANNYHIVNYRNKNTTAPLPTSLSQDANFMS